LLLLAVLVGGFAAWARPAAHAAPGAGQPGPADWPMFLNNPERQSWNNGETALSPKTAPALRLRWKKELGGALVASPAVAGDTVYLGAWDGKEYALNTADGSIRWSIFLGTTSASPQVCKPDHAGVTSGAAVADGRVYVGGGADNFYALDAATGRPVWALFTGDSRPENGAYNWASPLVAGGRVYSGIASFCDRPFVRGFMWGADLADGKNARYGYMVPDGTLGGGIWTSPTLDAAHHRMFLTTGSPGNVPGHVDSIVAVDLNTYEVVDAWRVPGNEEVKDPDWGTTPTLFTAPDGKLRVAAGNKNGFFYVFDADHLDRGPLWQTRVAILGDCPQCGEGTIASAVYHDGVLYLAGGKTTVGGKETGGALRAFDATTGTLRWEYPLTGSVYASPAGANGVIVVAGDNEVHVVDAVTGRRLFIFGTAAPIYAAPVIANGAIYAPSTDGFLYVYEVPPELIAPTATPTAVATATPTPTPTPPPPAAVSPVPNPVITGTLYFSATGHTLAPPLRDYWQRYGGLAQFGYPLTEPFTETVTIGPGDGPTHFYLVQYFERARFEYHPENAGTPSAVLLGLLGVHFYPPEDAALRQTDPGVIYLNGHNLGGAFRAYWEKHGGLFVNGYPISEEHDEVSPTDGKTYRVQYFQRVRMEHHPEYAGTDHEVLLGLLGSQLLRERGWLR
jgi:outer membrane protein assembly factor BamB